MIPSNILHDIQDRLMDSMMDLYNNCRDDDDAKALAFLLVEIYNNVEFELVLRGEPVA